MTAVQIIVTSCSRRALELEQVRAALRGNGLAVIDDDWQVSPQADWVLLSTCGFTQAAEDFGFETLERINLQKKPQARVILGGCVPEINPERVRREHAGPKIGPRSYHLLDEILSLEPGFASFPRPNTFQSPYSRAALIYDLRSALGIIKTFDGSFAGLQHISERLGNGLRRRLIFSRYAHLVDGGTWYIQIQEGCSMHCSYCVICKAIGALKSKPEDEILQEFECGLRSGYRHFQLVGDNAGSYGLDTGSSLGKLLDKINAFPGQFDIDLTDINPVYLPVIIEPVRRLLSRKRLARLYIPIQTASRRVLRLMQRDCSMGQVKEMLADIKRQAPSGFRLGTSLIVGFPTETDAELDETIAFCREVGFDWVWCHSFSARPGVPAASIAGELPPAEILHRARRVRTELSPSTLVVTAQDTTGSRTCQG